MCSNMLSWILISNAILGVNCFLTQTAVHSCEDLDTKACQLFNTSNPNLCNEDKYAHQICPRFCGTCPIECYSCTASSRDPNTCKKTISCGEHKTCMTKHMIATDDGHSEYIMSCERKEICEGLVFGFGKRWIDGYDSKENDRFRRSFYISCCHSDFCNAPQNILASTMSPLLSTTAPNYGCHRDIVFVLDDSDSIGYSNFLEIINFLSKLVKQITIGDSHAKIALVTYSYSVKINWYLKDYTNKQDVHIGLRTIHFEGGNTHTEKALEVVIRNVLTQDKGDRPAAENAVVVMTDGNSNLKTETLNQAQLLHTKAKDVVSLIVGSSPDINEINNIATDSHHVLDIHRYSHLESYIPKILKLICS